MNTCMNCQHWNPKATDTNMLRYGFAKCDKKPLPGHTLSAKAAACEKFAAIDQAWRGTYTPPTKEARAAVMRARIESQNAPSIWTPLPAEPEVEQGMLL